MGVELLAHPIYFFLSHRKLDAAKRETELMRQQAALDQAILRDENAALKQQVGVWYFLVVNIFGRRLNQHVFFPPGGGLGCGGAKGREQGQKSRPPVAGKGGKVSVGRR